MKKPLILFALLLACATAPAWAQVSPMGDSKILVPPGAGALIGNDVAYDPVNQVYLAVIGYGELRAAWVDANGDIIGVPFSFGSTSRTDPFAHFPRVHYGPDLNSGAGGFLITWHQNPGANTVHSVVAAYPRGVISSEQVFSDGSEGGTNFNTGTAIAYSPTSRRFLVAWGTLVWGLHARFVDGQTGAPDGEIMRIASGGFKEPSIAWNPATNDFGLAYAGWNEASAFVAFRRINAATGTISAPESFGFAGGTFAPGVAVNTATNQYVVGWTNCGGCGTQGIVLSQNGSPGSQYLLTSRLGTPTSFSIAFNPTSGTFLTVSEDPLSIEVAASELSASGTQLGSPAAITAGASTGSFVPRVVARNGAKHWNISYSRNQNSLANQLVTTGSTGTPGPAPAPAVPVSTPGTMSSPTPSSTLPGAAVTFSWSQGTGVTSFWLDVGTARGGYDLYSAGQGTGTSRTVSGLPGDGSTLWVRLYSLIDGTWAFRDYSYTAASLATPGAISTPTAGSTLPGASVTFSWSAGSGVSYYWLDVGTTRGGYEIFSRYQSGTAATVANIPTAGGAVWVRLWSRIGSAWEPRDFQFTAATVSEPAVMSTPSVGSVLPGASATFAWTAGTGVAYYWLDIGRTRGGYELYSKYNATTSATISILPTSGGTLWVRLWSRIGGAWEPRDFQYTAATVSAPGEIASPASGSTLPSRTASFTWTAGVNVSYFWLDIGTTRGDYSLLSKYMGANTSYTHALPSGLPAGTRVWVRLWSRIGGAWEVRDVPYILP